MIVFCQKSTGLLVAVNLKVMFSFFATEPGFERINSDVADFMIVRNPYHRAVSTFFDKCRDHVQRATELSQRAILSALTFDMFCELLPVLSSTDDHFWPQSRDLEQFSGRKLFRMESDLPRLGQALGVDFNRKANETKHEDPMQYYNEHTDNIVQKVYAEDFMYFDYPKR